MTFFHFTKSNFFPDVKFCLTSGLGLILFMFSIHVLPLMLNNVCEPEPFTFGGWVIAWLVVSFVIYSIITIINYYEYKEHKVFIVSIFAKLIFKFFDVVESILKKIVPRVIREKYSEQLDWIMIGAGVILFVGLFYSSYINCGLDG